MNKQLIHQREVVALEAFAISDVAGLLKRVFPSVTEGITSFVGRFSPNEPGVSLTSDQSFLLRELPKHNYLDVADLTAYKPAGLAVPLIDYVEALKPAAERAAETFHKYLPGYTMILSRLINDESFQLASSDLTRDFANLEKEREKLYKNIGDCFKKGDTGTTTTYEKLVKRNGDWKEVIAFTEHMTNTMNKVDRKLLNKKIEETVELLSVLAAKIERGELQKVSPQVVKALSEGAYQLGAELEFFSVVYYRLMELTGTMNQTMEHFKKSMTA